MRTIKQLRRFYVAEVFQPQPPIAGSQRAETVFSQRECLCSKALYTKNQPHTHRFVAPGSLKPGRRRAAWRLNPMRSRRRLAFITRDIEKLMRAESVPLAVLIRRPSARLTFPMSRAITWEVDNDVYQLASQEGAYALAFGAIAGHFSLCANQRQFERNRA